MKPNPRQKIEIYHPQIQSSSKAIRKSENINAGRIEDTSIEAELERLLKEKDAA